MSNFFSPTDPRDDHPPLLDEPDGGLACILIQIARFCLHVHPYLEGPSIIEKETDSTTNPTPSFQNSHLGAALDEDIGTA